MVFWVREFQNRKSGQRFRVYSERQYVPPLREEVAKYCGDDDWLDDSIYEHDAGLDVRFDGACQLEVEAI